MRIGIDFDNTIVCYDPVFFLAAREQELIPEDVPPTKSGVRDYLRRIGREDDWTVLQGYIYGARMELADPFPGALDFIRRARAAGIEIFIVSHKTRTPYLGPEYDLHAAATGWLESQGAFSPSQVNLERERVFFELTKNDKIARIAALSCTHFIDDLPEFLAEPGFPVGMEKLLFEPGNEERQVDTPMRRMRSWDSISRYLLGAAKTS